METENKKLTLYAPIMKMSKDDEYLCVLSDTSIDRDGEIVSKTFMEMAAGDNYMPALIDHDNKALNLVAEWVDKRVVEVGPDRYAFTAKPKFYLSNPNAKIIKDMMDKDGAKFGLSITAIPYTHDYAEFEGKKVKRWQTGEIVSTDFVGIPAQKYAMAAKIAKSLGLEKAMAKCPYCGSTDVDEVMGGSGSTGRWKCNKCGKTFSEDQLKSLELEEKRLPGDYGQHNPDSVEETIRARTGTGVCERCGAKTNAKTVFGMTLCNDCWNKQTGKKSLEEPVTEKKITDEEIEEETDDEKKKEKKSLEDDNMSEETIKELKESIENLNKKVDTLMSEPCGGKKKKSLEEEPEKAPAPAPDPAPVPEPAPEPVVDKALEREEKLETLDKKLPVAETQGSVEIKGTTETFIQINKNRRRI